ncbi:MAG: PCRF domain-containing protein, partial [Rhodocyclales bacterium]|nr:PCRF domain-containing protein [Rhodocyclales bacterium]
MKSSIRDKLEQLTRRKEELDAMLGDELATRDMDNYRRLTREHAEIEPVVALYGAYQAAEADIAAAREMLGDPEMKAMAEEEIAAGEAGIVRLDDELQKALLPRDPNDERNIFLEIRAGTGGDESALFAGDLYRMYTRYAERQGWKVEQVSASESDLGGFKEVIVRIAGNGAYSKLKFESGGHRV